MSSTMWVPEISATPARFTARRPGGSCTPWASRYDAEPTAQPSRPPSRADRPAEPTAQPPLECAHRDFARPVRSPTHPEAPMAQTSPLAGKPAPADILIDVDALTRAYYERRPDPGVPAECVAFGTSGQRGPHPGYHPCLLYTSPSPRD